MKRPLAQGVILAVIMLGLAVVSLWVIKQVRVAEPSYQGVSASDWIIKELSYLCSDNAYVKLRTVMVMPAAGPGTNQYAMPRSGPGVPVVGPGTVLRSVPGMRVAGPGTNRFWFAPLTNRLAAPPALLVNSGTNLNIFVRYRGNTREAITALRQIGAPAVPHLIRALKTRNGIFNGTYVKMYPKLVSLLGNRIPAPPQPAVDMRRAAAEALREMTDVAKPAFPALLVASKDQDDGVSRSAIQALHDLSVRNPEIHEVLLGLIKARTPNAEAVKMVSQFHLRGPKAIQVLAEALQDNNVSVRSQAAVLLQQFGPAAESALSAVFMAMHGKR